MRMFFFYLKPRLGLFSMGVRLPVHSLKLGVFLRFVQKGLIHKSLKQLTNLCLISKTNDLKKLILNGY